MRRNHLQKETVKKPLHKNIRILAWVSFFTDASSEIIYPIIPFFITVTMGAPAAVLGIIEGLAEALSAAAKGMSGPLSDRTRRRKSLVFSGYALSSLSKLALALSTFWATALAARLTERIGKGIRTPARDALLAECADAGGKGRAFGFHRAMDTWGAVTGTATAFILLLVLHNDFRSIILISLLPAFVAVVLTLRIAEQRDTETAAARPLWSQMFSPPRSKQFRNFVAAYGIFSLGASSATFFILRARYIELSYAEALLPYLFANIVYAATSERAGRLSDTIGRKRVMLAGMLLFTIAYTIIFLSPSTPAFFIALACYGLYLAATEGIGKAFITDMVSREEYGRALGFFYFITGLSTLAASIAAGILWDQVSPRAPFLQGACFGLLGIVLFARLTGERPGTTP